MSQQLQGIRSQSPCSYYTGLSPIEDRFQYPVAPPFFSGFTDSPLHESRFFFPNKEQPKVSEIYYQEIRNRLSAESSQSDNIFENTSVDLGDVKIGKSKKAHFKITNQTDGLLVIKDIKTSCGCTTPQWDKRPIRAGQLSELTVIFKAETHGYNKKNIMVFHNKTKYPIRLTITANVTE